MLSDDSILRFDGDKKAGLNALSSIVCFLTFGGNLSLDVVSVLVSMPSRALYAF